MTQIRPYAAADRTSVARLNVNYYTTTHGFDEAFAAAVSGALDKLGQNDLGWVVTRQGDVAGSLLLFAEAPGAGRLRLFLLRPDLQGKGLGRALLSQALSVAPSLRMTRLDVSSFTIHTAACALYAASGFTETGRASCRAFGHELEQVDFTRIINA